MIKEKPARKKLRLEAVPNIEVLAPPRARMRLANFSRPPSTDETLLDALVRSRVTNALIDPYMLTQLVSEFPAAGSVRLSFVRTSRAWRMEIDAEIASADDEHGASQQLANLLRVAAPRAVFKPSPASVTEDNPASVRLAPCADPVQGGDGALVWLAPARLSRPDFAQALAAADACSVKELSFTLRPLVLTADDRALLETARFRVAAQSPLKPRAEAQAEALTQWIEAGKGCAIEVTALPRRPLEKSALDVLCAALFGRAARSDIGAPDLDLRLAAPAGHLPCFRFWPIPDDFVRNLGIEAPVIPDGPGVVTLGCDAADDLIYFGGPARTTHVFTLGGTGTGKTTFIGNLVVEDMRKGEGVLLIDPHGDLADHVRARVPEERRGDVIWVDAGDENLEWRLDPLFLRGRNPEVARNRIANQFLAFFQQMYAGVPEALGPAFQQHFRAGILLLMAAKNEEDRDLTKFEDVFADDEFRRRLGKECSDPKIVQIWKLIEAARGESDMHNIAPYITNKMTQISGNPLTRSLIGGTKPRLDLRAAMDQKKIVIVRLSKGVIGDYDARFLGALFLMSLIEASFSRADIKPAERVPFRVYVDEFQTLATEMATQALAECRKYEVCLTLANQSLSQLAGNTFNHSAVGHAALANCGTFVLFRLNPTDAALMASIVAGVSAHELTQLGVGEMIVRRQVKGIPLSGERLFGLPPDHWDCGVR